MKITFFLRGLGLGGVERCAALVGEGLAERGFDVTLVTLGDATNLWQERTRRVKVVDLSQAWQPRKPWTWLAGWRAARQLAREADIVVAATFLMPLYMSWAATRGLGKRLIGWVHGPLADVDASAHMNPLHRFACQTIYRRLKQLVFVSRHARASMGKWLKQPEAPGWDVIPNFVENIEHRPPRYPGNPLRLLFVGRIDVEKQPTLWLDTLSALVSRGQLAKLTVLGDGPLRSQLQAQAEQRGLAALIEFMGTRHDVADFMHRADFLLLTSWFEGCPLVVLEAMKAGLPVVTTAAGGVVELFGEYANDFVSPAATGEALADLVLAQVPRHPALAGQLRLRAYDYDKNLLLDRWAALLGSPVTLPARHVLDQEQNR
ncbi:glycosyltransferase involved in cell wall biosynthesis [Silvimonas terrae]|uniref:Glycosyltransferase involved in cell wall biosynthesis n=1 Tax=Silvimonas terrae TaxID=300266 RepID=A0A840RGX8_9NEIS|nr:glycosyltransferase [Silvimonas terrae]MBB5191542.1 glycosyltransferase involved in cell wall biosynthesis [Silvimonas terrae]